MPEKTAHEEALSPLFNTIAVPAQNKIHKCGIKLINLITSSFIHWLMYERPLNLMVYIVQRKKAVPYYFKSSASTDSQTVAMLAQLWKIVE